MAVWKAHAASATTVPSMKTALLKYQACVSIVRGPFPSIIATNTPTAMVNNPRRNMLIARMP